MYKIFLSFILIFLVWAPKAQANQIWSGDHPNRQQFAKAYPYQVNSSGSALSPLISFCFYSNGKESCHSYPKTLSPVQQVLFQEQPEAWSSFFNQCRGFDSLNKLQATADIITILTPGGLGVLLKSVRVGTVATTAAMAAYGATELAKSRSIDQSQFTPEEKEHFRKESQVPDGGLFTEYQVIPREYDKEGKEVQNPIDRSEQMVKYLLSGKDKAGVFTMDQIAELKVTLDVCSQHMDSTVLSLNRRACMNGCHGGNKKESLDREPAVVGPTPLPKPVFNQDEAIGNLREYLSDK